MKCPKCRYLSFEPELRCKHCGFDFSMADTDLPLGRFDELEHQDPDLPMVDLQLHSTAAEIDEPPAPPLSVVRPRQETAATSRRSVGAVAVAERARQPRPPAAPVARQVPTPNTDLPLFIKGVVVPDTAEVQEAAEAEAKERAIEDAEVHVPAAPRPLAVRRRAPEPPRQITAAGPVVRAVPINRGDTDLLDYLRRVETEAAPAARPVRVASAPRVNLSHSAQATLPPAVPGEVDAPARLKAAGLDLLLLVSLNTAVLLLTLRQCDLSITEIAKVPALPLGGFLVSLTVGYLLSFTVANGQTVGKMVFGLRVVSDAAEDTPTPRQMSYRALLTIPSVLALGLGFLPGLVGEGRAVHDRLTHTRVVRE